MQPPRFAIPGWPGSAWHCYCGAGGRGVCAQRACTIARNGCTASRNAHPTGEQRGWYPSGRGR